MRFILFLLVGAVICAPCMIQEDPVPEPKTAAKVKKPKKLTPQKQ